MSTDGVGAIAVILIASFAIDRTVTAVLYLLSYVPLWDRYFPDPIRKVDAVERAVAEKRLKLPYYVLAGLLGIVVLAGYGKVGILTALLGEGVNRTLDTILTGLTVVAGADRVAAILERQGREPSAASAPRPLEVSGRLVLDRSGPQDDTP